MAVLVQELLPASYSFVLHSHNPFMNQDDINKGVEEMYGELVTGLGETLVGNYEGRALSWKMRKGGSPELVGMPSKSVALRSKACLIFRSDSNGEDLEGFAGAGLFESVTTRSPEVIRVRYRNLRIITDHVYRDELFAKIGNLAFTVADKFDGVPMDIEGVVIGDNTLGVVQARPQV
eukprot:GHVO01012899.1.p1 GENE.GHVO01012899.1~~GHVO01012899.1.p1  ORF type:complete len:203 (-),score=34.37 GHVO01012899.1:113-643(-)